MVFKDFHGTLYWADANCLESDPINVIICACCILAGLGVWHHLQWCTGGGDEERRGLQVQSGRDAWGWMFFPATSAMHSKKRRWACWGESSVGWDRQSATGWRRRRGDKAEQGGDSCTTRTVRERIPGVYGRDGSSDFGDLCVLPAGSRHNQLFGEANQRQPPWQDKHPGPVWEAQHRWYFLQHVAEYFSILSFWGVFNLFLIIVSCSIEQFRKNCVFIHFDADLASEAHARPNYRPPPMTEGLARKLIWGALRGRGCSPVGKNPEPDVPCQGDVLCILDGGRDCPALMTPFKQGKGPGYHDNDDGWDVIGWWWWWLMRFRYHDKYFLSLVCRKQHAALHRGQRRDGGDFRRLR